MRSKLIVTSLPCRIKLSKAFNKHKSRNYWVKRCQAYKRSGLSLRMFCQSQGLPTSSFHRWFRRLELEGYIGGFIPVEVDESPLSLGDERLAKLVSINPPCEEETPKPATDFKLMLDRGLVLTIPKNFDAVTLRQIVEVLSL